MSCWSRSPRSEQCHRCAQPHHPCPSPGMGNPPKTPAHPTLIFCFYSEGGGCPGRAGAAGGRERGECPPDPIPSLGTHPARCHTEGAAGDPSATGVAPREGRAVLVLIPSLVGVMSLGWGCTCGRGLHVSPPAPPTRGWGVPVSPGPRTHPGTAMGTVREGRAVEGTVPGTPSSTYEQGDQHKPPAGLGPVQLQDLPLPHYFFTLMREW